MAPRRKSCACCGSKARASGLEKEVRNAWGEAYDILARAMLKGMIGDEDEVVEKQIKEQPHEEREAKELSALFDRLNKR